MMKIFGFEIKKIKKYKGSGKKPVKPKLSLDLELIHALKEQGLSNYEIARKFHCSEGTIRNRLKEYAQLQEKAKAKQ